MGGSYKNYFMWFNSGVPSGAPMSLSFDGSLKTITISSVDILDVRDLWSRWYDWWVSSDNSKYGIAMTQVGGNDIDTIAGTKIPVYIFLQNGWKIKPREANHTLSVVNGILLTSDSSDPFINTTGSYVVRINYQQPVQAISFSTSGGTGISEQDKQDIADLIAEDLLVINNNVKKASLLIPATENI